MTSPEREPNGGLSNQQRIRDGAAKALGSDRGGAVDMSAHDSSNNDRLSPKCITSV